MDQQNHVTASKRTPSRGQIRCRLFPVALAACFAASAVQAASPGSVVAWGDNSRGQTIVPVAAQSGVIAIAAGELHSLALKNDGSVVAWGNNDDGQATVPAEAQSGVIALSVGEYHSVALKNDGSVVAWGNNGSGRADVPVAAQSGVTAISAGAWHTLALKSDGSVVGWGENDDGQTTIPPAAQSGVVATSAGARQSLALKNDGSIVVWGWLGSGQPVMHTNVIAIGGGDSYTATLQSDGTLRTSLGEIPEVTAFSVGVNHILALKADGSLLGWGASSFRQTSIPIAARNGALSVAAGGYHSLAIVPSTAPVIITQPGKQTAGVRQNSSISVAATGPHLGYQWRKDGTNLSGGTGATYNFGLTQTGQAGSYSVVVSNFLGSVTSAPAMLSVVVTNMAPSPGSVVAWGNNDYGQTSVPVTAQSGVVAISARDYHTLALKSDDSVIAWGHFNNYGETTVPVSAQSGVAAIAAGGRHSVALKMDGSVIAWGCNLFGQTTVPVAAQREVVAIAAGSFHTVALKNDGSVVAWGWNYHSQTTVPMAAQSGVIAIAAGGGHTVALKNDGSVVAWGLNDSGQTDVPMSAQTGVTAIVAMPNSTVALKTDGSLLLWGYNNDLFKVPQMENGVIAIAAGALDIAALKSDGEIVTWGWNVDGQSAVPVAAQSRVLAISMGASHVLALVGAPASLMARSAGNKLILSWASDAVGYNLQSSTDLSPSPIWLDVANAPVLVGAHFTVTNSLSSSRQFYRLRKP